MVGHQKNLLKIVAAALGFCAIAGFAMGLTSTFSRKIATGEEDETPIAANLPSGVVIKDAQAIAPPPPPVPAVAKPKTDALADAASGTPPSSAPGALAVAKPAAPVAAPAESAPGAPPSLAPQPIRPPAPLPTDLPPT